MSFIKFAVLPWMEEGRVVESGEVIEVFKNPQQPITKQFVEKNVMMKSMRYSITFQHPFAQGSSYSVFSDRTGDAVLFEAIRKLDATVSDFTGKGKHYAKGIGEHLIEEKSKQKKSSNILNKQKLSWRC